MPENSIGWVSVSYLRKGRILIMRRDKRHLGRENDSAKRVLYILGGALALTVIAFVAIFLLYGGDNSSTQIAKYNTSAIQDYTNSAEETSSQMGRTVNEMQNETANEIANETSETNVISNAVMQEEAEDEQEKYAVNTSSSETKAKENESAATESKTEQAKQEEEKDPEFASPVEGEIIREFAKENLVYSPTLDEWITHNGIDVAAEKTTVVKASADGTVSSIKNDPRYGLTVVIQHANGFSSVYSNLLTAEFIEEGETVKQGQTIATVGNTATFEIADESHLHFEILKDNVQVDPELYLK